MKGSDKSVVSGEVVKGKGRGRQLGFPTANIAISDIQRPPTGVYAGRALIDGKYYPAAIHVGPVPTFDETQPTLEVHLLDFKDSDLYGEKITVEIVARIRDVKKFETLAELSNAIKQDCDQTREVLKDYPAS